MNVSDSPSTPSGKPAVPVEAPPADAVEAADALPAVPRFCNACGTSWQADWVECHACARRRYLGARRAATAAIDAPSHGNGPITSAISLYFSYLGISVLMMIFIAAGAGIVNLEFVMSALASVMVLIWCVVRRREVGPALRRTPGLGWYLLAAAGSVLTFAVASLALLALNHAFGVPTLRMTDPFVKEGYGLATLILVIAIQPGVIEELAFRGVVLGGLRHVLSPVEAIVVSAAMFMILHLAVPSFPHLFVMGLALGWLRTRTGSLYPGMLLHFCHNFLCIAFEYWRH